MGGRKRERTTQRETDRNRDRGGRERKIDTHTGWERER